MIIERSEISLRIRIETGLQGLRDNAPLYLQRPCRDIHHLIKTLIEISFIHSLISYPRQIYRDHSD